MRYDTMTAPYNNNDDTCPLTCDCSIFIFPMGWYGVSEIEQGLSMCGKTQDAMISNSRKERNLQSGVQENMYKIIYLT